MGDTSGIFHILLLLYIYYRTYVGVCVTPLFFFFGVRCAQYKVHAQCSFAALAPHMPCMLLVYISFSNFMHLSSDNYVGVDACRMWYYEMWFYDGTCDGGRILEI